MAFLTFEQKTKRFRELMNDFSLQIEEAKSDIMKTRQETDEMFARVTINMNRRQEVIDAMNAEIFNEDSVAPAT
jgi:hypothetical protein